MNYIANYLILVLLLLTSIFINKKRNNEIIGN